MGFFDWIRGKGGSKGGPIAAGLDSEDRKVLELSGADIKVRDLLEGNALEYGVRKAAFYGCVNYLADLIGKVTVHYFRGGEEVHGPESWRWNYEPNRNQNASAFWHQLITRLYEDGDALIIDEPYGTGAGFVVADTFTVDNKSPTTVYRDVRYRDRWKAAVRQDACMYIRLNDKRMEPVWRAMSDAFLRLASAAMQNYLYNGGQHWKVAVEALNAGDTKGIETLQKVIEQQIQPFLAAGSAVLPQFEGYEYTQLSGSGKEALSSKDLREIIQEIWSQQAMGMGIPPVLILGKVADDKSALTRLLSGPVDAIVRQVQQEANRVRLGRERVQGGEYLHFDTSSLIHFDVMEAASNMQALIGSAIYSVNDILRAIGKPPIPEDWANKHYLTLNIGQSPVEDTPQDAAE